MIYRDETLRDLARIDHAAERGAIGHKERTIETGEGQTVPYIAAAGYAAIELALHGSKAETASKALAPTLVPNTGGNPEHLALESALSLFEQAPRRQPLIARAIVAASEAHANQQRKASGAPYISHPISIAIHLASIGTDEACIAAALVHDVLEDTDWNESRLAKALGRNCAHCMALVRFATEPDKTLSWHERKQTVVAKLHTASTEERTLVIADKSHNLRSLIRALRNDGPAAWSQLHHGQPEQSWFAHSLAETIRNESGEPFDSYRATVRDAVETGWLHKSKGPTPRPNPSGASSGEKPTRRQITDQEPQDTPKSEVTDHDPNRRSGATRPMVCLRRTPRSAPARTAPRHADHDPQLRADKRNNALERKKIRGSLHRPHHRDLRRPPRTRHRVDNPAPKLKGRTGPRPAADPNRYRRSHHGAPRARASHPHGVPRELGGGS